MGEGKSKQKMRQGKTVRLNINARERRRMHDLVRKRSFVFFCGVQFRLVIVMFIEITIFQICKNPEPCDL